MSDNKIIEMTIPMNCFAFKFWGKVKENANNVTIQGDATVILPLIISALFERI